tara:strand:+ start:45 stop:362 length:318 start_codon:yes stop_codon:yes gene_type:complete
MSKYKLQKDDYKLVLEFRKNLFENNYYHSPSLQRILNLFRSGATKGKYVLFKPSNKKLWYLATLPEKRGHRIKINYKISFDNPLDAEWYVFKKRWKKHTGRSLKI